MGDSQQFSDLENLDLAKICAESNGDLVLKHYEDGTEYIDFSDEFVDFLWSVALPEGTMWLDEDPEEAAYFEAEYGSPDANDLGCDNSELPV